jgi:preprotein translocase subunit SecA
MTGTAKTSEVEFEKIYNLPVEEIPTAWPNLRNDLPDFVYKDDLSKWTAIARECKSISKTKKPILIGTTTVEDSDMLADLLKEYQLLYRLLNEKPENVKRESEQPKNWHDRTSSVLYTKYVCNTKNYFPPEPKN